MSIVSFMIIAMLTLGGCTMQNTTEIPKQAKEMKLVFQNITPEQAKERLTQDENIVLLDVRTNEEYKEAHIPNSMLIPLDVLENEAGTKLKDKDAVIFVYCRSGRRSLEAADILTKQGYKNIYDLGGIIDWPYETESGE